MSDADSGTAHPLRRWRRKHDHTLTEAGKALGLAKSTLSKIENGRVPSAKVMPRICKVTGLSPNDFYEFREVAA